MVRGPRRGNTRPIALTQERVRKQIDIEARSVESFSVEPEKGLRNP